MTGMDIDALLHRSFELASSARVDGDHPFGALLAVDGAITAEAQNRVNTDHDVTAHAETMLVRILEQQGRLGELAIGIVVASCEPCPMCVGALFWAGARHVAYGLSSGRLMELGAAPGAEPFGFTITAPEIGSRAAPPMRIDGPHREDEAALAHVGFWPA